MSLVLPTGGLRAPRRRVRLVAVLAARDEERFLPDWLANVGPQVDAIVALDDGSSDRTRALLAGDPRVVEVITPPQASTGWDEVGNHRALVDAALRHGADWIVSLDADERVEHGFRDRVERAVRRGKALGLEAFSVRVLDLWDTPATVRVDGVWGRKRSPRLFRARADHAFDERPLHAAKAPLQARRAGRFPPADLRLYHLRMIDPADRARRRERYERLDPDRRWQALGYAYLTDEGGLRLRPVSPRRGFAPLPG